MNTLTFTQRRFSARLFAVLTIVSLLLSAFPAAFFAAEAAVGPSIVPQEGLVTTFDAGDEVPFTASDGGFAEGATVYVNLASGNDGVFSLGNNGGNCTGDFDKTSVTIASNKTNASFCYKNDTPGSDTITATFSSDVEDDVVVIYDVTIEEVIVEEKKVDICHWNGEVFNLLNVSISSIGNAHGSQGINDGDIIAAFGDYPGQNLGETYGNQTGAELLENDCESTITPPTETCDDGIQNQDETGVDEGGVCESEVPPPPPPINGCLIDGEVLVTHDECEPEPVATVVATKIVCTDESDLPNWNTVQDGAPKITSSTASDWVADPEHESCSIVPDWEFEWSSSSTTDPGDLIIGSAGDNWTTFTGSTQVPASVFSGDNTFFWMREVMQANYIPFTHETQGEKNTDDVTAEFYCHNDGKKYDNRELVNHPKVDKEYYCVAWNVPTEPVEECPDGYAGTYPECVPPQEPDIVNTCILPYSLEDNEGFTLNLPLGDELSLEAILSSFGYGSVDVIGDENNTQIWNFASSETGSVTLTVTLLGKYATNNQAFGYYKAGDDSTFVPVFKVGAHSAAVPTLSVGESLEITIPNNVVNSLGFALDTEGESSNVWFSEFNQNVNNEDNLSVYNPDENVYLLAFEDLSDSDPSDNDRNDLVLKITSIKCNPVDVEPETYRIDGKKYKIEGEATTTLAGWTINLEDGDENIITSTTTDSNGYYYFDVPEGYYEVHEAMQSNWTQYMVEQNGDPVDGQYCSFLLGTPDNLEFLSISKILQSESSYSCDFYNVYIGGSDPEPKPIDMCLNMDGVQETVPEGYEADGDGVCEESGGGSYSSGTRVIKKVSPAPLVLGASTDQCPFIKEYMQMGWSNNSFEVTKLQLFLNNFRSLYGGVENPVTGVFGSTTDANVKAFQEKYRSEILDPWNVRGVVPHSESTGFVYKTTLWKINSIICPDYAVLPSFDGENLLTNVDLDVTPISD